MHFDSWKKKGEKRRGIFFFSSLNFYRYFPTLPFLDCSASCVRGFFKKGVGSLRAENPRHGMKDQTTMEITETTKMHPPARGQGRATPDSDGVCLQRYKGCRDLGEGKQDMVSLGTRRGLDGHCRGGN